MLRLADWFLILFHTSLVLFNAIGWIWRKTRPWHLATLAATAFSWFILGIWFGQGYCLCTDIHWRVREALGQPIHDKGYIQFLVHSLTGWQPDAHLTETVTATVFAVSVVLSVVLNIRDTLQNRRKRIRASAT